MHLHALFYVGQILWLQKVGVINLPRLEESHP
jgi:hypothetical protein